MNASNARTRLTGWHLRWLADRFSIAPDHAGAVGLPLAAVAGQEPICELALHHAADQGGWKR